MSLFNNAYVQGVNPRTLDLTGRTICPNCHDNHATKGPNWSYCHNCGFTWDYIAVTA